METAIHHSITTSYTQNSVSPSYVTQFFNWCKAQEENRFKWLALALAVHGCALTPITMFAIILSNNSMIFWVLALAAMGVSLVTNLAALPTKITIPAFILSIIVDLGVIIACLAIGFDITKTYI